MPTQESKVQAPHPAEVPLYTLTDVVRYLRLPVPAAFSLSGRKLPHPDCWHPEFWWHAYRTRRNRGIRSIFEERFPPLTFQEFALAFVRGSLFHFFAVTEDEPGALVDLVIDSCEGRFFAEVKHLGRPFEDKSPQDVAREAWPGLPSAAQEKAAKIAAFYADRVTVEGGLAVQLFPFSRDEVADDPRAILIDPRRRFGQPTVAGTGTPTEVIADRFRAGDSVADLAEDYGMEAQQVEESLRYEQRTVPFWPEPMWIW